METLKVPKPTSQPPSDDNSIIGEETMIECSNGRGDDEDV